jgi:hypothetical protein
VSQPLLVVLARGCRAAYDIERLERIFRDAGHRPAQTVAPAAQRRHDERLANSPWFKLWQHLHRCRPEAPITHALHVGDTDPDTPVAAAQNHHADHWSGEGIADSR